jgi:hypothetical protein
VAEQWYLARDNQKHGPYSSAQLQEFARAGRILPTDMLLKDGTAKWIPASQVKGLFPQPSPKAVSSPPQPVPAAIPLTEPPAADPFQELGGGSSSSRPSAAHKARNFFTSNWTSKKIAIVTGSAAGCLLLLVVLILVMSGGGSTPNVAKVDFAKGPKGEEVFKVEEKNRVFMAFRDKAKKQIRHGLFIEFHDNDKAKKKIEGNFFAGQWHGKVMAWHDNGKQESERHFDKGKPVGTHKGWRTSGELAWEFQYGSDGTPRTKEATVEAFVHQHAFLHRATRLNKVQQSVDGYDWFVGLDKMREEIPLDEFLAFLGKPHEVKNESDWSKQEWVYRCRDGTAGLGMTNFSAIPGGGGRKTVTVHLGRVKIKGAKF